MLFMCGKQQYLCRECKFTAIFQKLVANGKHYCNFFTVQFLEASSNFLRFVSTGTALVSSERRRKWFDASSCGVLGFSGEDYCYWADLQRLLTRLKGAVRQSRHYCILLNQSSSASPNFSLSETGSLMLLWPYWACANTAQGNSIKTQHLLWVYPTERTETRLHFV